jgi:aspartyl protease family protein
VSCALAAALASGSMAQGSSRSISFTGSMGDRALLVIDGTPRTLAPGMSWQGVKLLSLSDGEARIEVDGKPAALRIGAPVSVSRGGPSTTGTTIVLNAVSGGHFVTSGSINGRAVSFLVDTGATTVAMSQGDAQRIGLDLRQARRSFAQTANGVTPVYLVNLTSVRIGEVEIYNVEATVMPAPMSHVLLGNSFLTRFQMKRINDVMTLEKR